MTGDAAARHSKKRSWWHTVVPLVMIAVATLAAGTAYMAALAEHRSNNLERMLAQGHLLGMTERQRLLDQGLANTRLSALRNRHLDVGYRLAKRISKADPTLAVRYMLEAQAEFASARMLLPFLAVAWNPFDSRLDWEQSLQRSIVWPLVDMGFDVAWSAPQPAENATGALAGSAKKSEAPPSIWHRLESRIDNADGQVLSLTLGVVLFVSGLVFLTLSDVSKRLFFVRFYFAVGMLISLGTIAYVIKVAPETVRYAPYVGAFIVVLAAIGWKLGSADKGADPAASPQAQGEAASRFTRVTAMLISVTVLLSALCAYGYSKAESAAGDAAVEAMQHEVEMHSRSSRSSAAIYGMFDGLADMLDARVREKAARQYAAHLAAIGETSEAEMALTRADAMKAITQKKQNQSYTSILDHPYLGVTGDPRFPERIASQYALRTPNENYWEPFALWDASNHKSLVYHRQATGFLGTLSVIAIALYILGQALSVPSAMMARALVAFSVLLVGAASAWAVSVVDLPKFSDKLTGVAKCRLGPKDRPEQETPAGYAARYFAIGMVRFGIAHTRLDFERASHALRCAVFYEPNFALARKNLSVSMALAAAASQSDDTYYSINTKAALPDVLANRRRANNVMAANGYAVPALSLNSEAVSLLWLGVAEGDLDRIKSSVDQLRLADQSPIDAGDANYWRPMVRLNIGIAELIKGDAQAADEAVERAITAGAGNDPAVVKSTLTVIQTLTAYCSHIHSDETCKQIRQQGVRMRERLVAATWPSKAGKPPGPPASIDNVRVSVDGQNLRWRGDLHNFDAAFDRLTVLWYVRDREWDSWRMLPPVSGAQSNTTARSAARGVAVSFLLASDFKRCLDAPGGPSKSATSRYLAEIYLNGTLAGQFETTGEKSPLEATRLIELNLGFCRPRGWQPVKLPEGGGELTSAFATAKGQPALLIMSAFSPAQQLIDRVPGTSAGATQELDVLAQAKAVLRRNGWIDGSEIVTDFNASGGQCSGAAPAGGLVSRRWTTPEGVEHVAIGIKRAASWKELCPVLQSINNRFRAVARVGP